MRLFYFQVLPTGAVTQGGNYYESFRDNNFIAINYDEIRHSDIVAIKKSTKDDVELFNGIKELALQERGNEIHHHQPNL